jgi:Flp pilus assembly protein TadG
MLSRFGQVLGRRGGDRGSMTVEFVIVVPVLLVLMLFLVMAGRVEEARGQADGTARDGARAASIALDPGDAQTWAEQAITDDDGSNVTCAQPTVDGFTAGSLAVTVTVQCTVNLGLGFGSWTVTGHAVSPLDPYVARTF